MPMWFLYMWLMLSVLPIFSEVEQDYIGRVQVTSSSSYHKKTCFSEGSNSVD